MKRTFSASPAGVPFYTECESIMFPTPTGRSGKRPDSTVATHTEEATSH